MNIKADSLPHDDLAVLGVLYGDEKNPLIAKSSAELESQIEALKSERQHERLLWILVTVVLALCLIGSTMPLRVFVVATPLLLCLFLYCCHWWDIHLVTKHIEAMVTKRKGIN